MVQLRLIGTWTDMNACFGTAEAVPFHPKGKSKNGDCESSLAGAYALGLQVLKHFFCPCQSLLHIPADIFSSDNLFEFGLVDHLFWLLSRTADLFVE